MGDNTEGSAQADIEADSLKYLIDEPASQDRFGAHSAIVEAIVSAFRTQPHVRLIGLLGRWGTGKSTIVSQLASELECTHKDKYVVFTYDAWAHQGDPVRRSILEELIARLIGLKLTRLSKWRETLLAVSGSTESSSTTTQTRLSAWGKLIVALLLLLPIFAGIVDADTVRKAFQDYPDSLSLGLVRAILIYFLLLIVIVAFARVSTLHYRMLIDHEAPIRRRLQTFIRSGEDLLSIMLTRQFPGTSSTTLRRSQPTAIEFRRYLRRIIESQRPRRLIFVIDNLDRIDPAQALEVWSIMVGMVADEAHRMDTTIEPIILLPFDPVALETIVPGDKLKGHSASDLIEKSFDITFEVPPPVLSNWREYFGDQYSDCGLRKWSGDSAFEQYWVIRNFESCLGKSRVTPRKINRFLNRVISLSQQQVQKFGPAIISYYIAHEDEIQRDRLEFVKSNKPGFDETNAWQRRIAAVAFGITEDEAAQVLLGDELADALSERDYQAFEGIREVAGFDEVVRNFVENPPRDDVGLMDPAPLTALAAFCGRSTGVSDVILWSRLWSSWKGANFGGVDKLTPAAIAAFLNAVPEQAKTDATFLAGRIVDEVAAGRDPEVVKELTKVGDQIAALAGEEFRFSVGTDTDVLLKILGNTAPSSSFAQGLKCDCSYEDLGKLVLAQLTGKLPIVAPETFRLVAERVRESQVEGEKKSFFTAVGEGLGEIFANAESADQTLIAAALILASRDGNTLRYQSVIKGIEDDATLEQAIQRATANGADPVVSALNALRLSAGSLPPGASNQSLATWLANDENAVRLIGSMRQMNGGSFLPALRNLEASGNDIDHVLRPLLVNAVRKSDIGARVHTSWLVKNFRKVAAWLTAAEATTYAKLLTSYSGFADGSGRLSDDDFLLFIEKLPSSEAKALLGERIASFDSPRLAKLIFDGDNVWTAFSRYRPEVGVDLTAKSELFNALVSVFSGSVGELGYRSIQRALKFANLLNANAQKQLVRTVVSTAIEIQNAGAIVSLASVEGFTDYLSRPSIASHAIAALFAKLRRSRDGQRFVERHASAIAQAGGSDRTIIKSGLERASDSKDALTAEWARYVMKKSGIDKG
jgi:hypothetical protein